MTLANNEARVIGIEVEHAIAGRRPPRPQTVATSPEETANGQSTTSVVMRKGLEYNPSELTRALWLAADGRDTGFRTNGARFYIDVNSHPEYCSPECTTLIDFLVADRAGSELLAQSVATVEAGDRTPGELHIYRNNRNLDNETWGTHENYEVRRQPFGGAPDAAIAALLASHLATRQIYTGAGGVAPAHADTNAITSPADRILCVSPKGLCVNSIYATSAMHANAPMVKHAGENDMLCTTENFRLQIVCGESNMSEVATALKLGVTRLLIAALESDPHCVDDLILTNPVRDMVAIAKDTSGVVRLNLANGHTTSALALQRKLLAKARAAVRAGQISAEEASIIPLWASTLDALGHRTPLATHRIDWLCKNNLIEQMAARKGVSPVGDEAVLLGATYHDLVHGIRPLLEQRGLLERLTDPAAVENAITTPPRGGRPETRSWIVTVLNHIGVSYTANWDGMTVCGHSMAIPNPRTTIQEAIAPFGKALAHIRERVPTHLLPPNLEPAPPSLPQRGGLGE